MILQDIQKLIRECNDTIDLSSEVIAKTTSSLGLGLENINLFLEDDVASIIRRAEAASPTVGNPGDFQFASDVLQTAQRPYVEFVENNFNDFMRKLPQESAEQLTEQYINELQNATTDGFSKFMRVADSAKRDIGEAMSTAATQSTVDPGDLSAFERIKMAGVSVFNNISDFVSRTGANISEFFSTKWQAFLEVWFRDVEKAELVAKIGEDNIQAHLAAIKNYTSFSDYTEFMNPDNVQKYFNQLQSSHIAVLERNINPNLFRDLLVDMTQNPISFSTLVITVPLIVMGTGAFILGRFLGSRDKASLEKEYRQVSDQVKTETDSRKKAQLEKRLGIIAAKLVVAK